MTGREGKQCIDILFRWRLKRRLYFFILCTCWCTKLKFENSFSNNVHEHSHGGRGRVRSPQMEKKLEKKGKNQEEGLKIKKNQKCSGSCRQVSLATPLNTRRYFKTPWTNAKHVCTHLNALFSRLGKKNRQNGKLLAGKFCDLEGKK